MQSRGHELIKTHVIGITQLVLFRITYNKSSTIKMWTIFAYENVSFYMLQESIS